MATETADARPAPDARCADCRRRLRRPSPSGYGPVCARRRGIRETPRPTVAASPSGPVPVVPGQTELDLYDRQPTLWSL